MAKSVRYVLVRPAERRAVLVEFKSLQEAQTAAGLDPNEVDHGSLGEGHGITVYEYGLMQPVAEQHLFSIGNRLYAGNAVIYAEADGKAVDARVPRITWYKDVDAVWEAIQQGDVIQPAVKVGDDVLWLWPDPKPSMMGA